MPRLDREASAAQPFVLPSVLTGLKVLVVDDAEDTLILFAAALSVCGAVVTTAASAAEALAQVVAARPDVVVSDIAMPGGDGYSLVREIRRLEDEALKQVPVVAATAFGREHSRSAILAAGFVDHLLKPVDPEDLCRAVARAAGR